MADLTIDEVFWTRPAKLTAEEAAQLGPFAPIAAKKCRYVAEWWAGRFGAPVYLIGSSLHSPTPRDVDIRIPITDAEFALRYQVDPKHWLEVSPGQLWIDDMAKMNRALLHHAHLNVDVQVWPKSHFRQDGTEGKLEALCLGAPSPRWFVPEVKA